MNVYNGLKAQVEELEKKAKYIHCAAHNLTLVLNDAVEGVAEIGSLSLHS